MEPHFKSKHSFFAFPTKKIKTQNLPSAFSGCKLKKTAWGNFFTTVHSCFCALYECYFEIASKTIEQVMQMQQFPTIERTLSPELKVALIVWSNLKQTDRAKQKPSKTINNSKR